MTRFTPPTSDLPACWDDTIVDQLARGGIGLQADEAHFLRRCQLHPGEVARDFDRDYDVQGRSIRTT